MNDSTLAHLSIEIGWAANSLIEALIHMRQAVEVLDGINSAGRLTDQLDDYTSQLMPIRDQLAAHNAAIEAALMCDLADLGGTQ